MEELDAFSADEFNARFRELLSSILLNPSTRPEKQPAAVLLGGQSGAGKTMLHVVSKKQMAGNAIVINGDEYRKLHPRFAEIQKRYGLDAPAHTAKWSGSMVEALIDALSGEGYNLIIEGTLRTSDAPMGTATLLRQRGYSVSLSLMAVKPEISLASCKIRYQQMRIAGTVPRAVDPARHQRIVNDIADNVAILEASDLFDSIAFYNRAGMCLFAAKRPTVGSPASMALKDILFGDWTEEEHGHYMALLEQLAVLEAQQ